MMDGKKAGLRAFVNWGVRSRIEASGWKWGNGVGTSELQMAGQVLGWNATLWVHLR